MKLCGYDTHLSDLGWVSLREPHTKHKLVTFYENVNNIPPPYVQDFIPFLVQEAKNYKLRNSNDIRTIHTNTIFYDNSLYQSLLILTELFQHNLINVSYLTACYLYQVMMTLHFLNDVANDAESTQK